MPKHMCCEMSRAQAYIVIAMCVFLTIDLVAPQNIRGSRSGNKGSKRGTQKEEGTKGGGTGKGGSRYEGVTLADQKGFEGRERGANERGRTKERRVPDRTGKPVGKGAERGRQNEMKPDVDGRARGNNNRYTRFFSARPVPISSSRVAGISYPSGRPFQQTGISSIGGLDLLGGLKNAALITGSDILNQLAIHEIVGSTSQGNPQQNYFGGAHFGNSFVNRPHNGFESGMFGNRPQNTYVSSDVGTRTSSGIVGKPVVTPGGFPAGAFAGRPHGIFGGSHVQNEPDHQGRCLRARSSCPSARILNTRISEFCTSEVTCGSGRKCCFDK